MYVILKNVNIIVGDGLMIEGVVLSMEYPSDLSFLKYDFML